MAEEKFDVVIFKNKTFGKLLEEIHTNSRATDKLIENTIQDMKDQIDDFGKALALMPHITTLLKSSIDNNEHLIKMASIVQKSLEKQKTVENDTISIFTEDDKKAFEELALEYESMNMLPTPNISTPVAELPEVIPVKRSKKK